ncbi:MAG: phosphotransferase [Thermoleophilia bacterium]|nr:phosphotransferase [Thermoleophilia bacterium]
MRPDDVAERVWPGRRRRIEPLGGGITNENFRVDVDGERYVLRIAGRNTDLLGIDRRAERDATLAASRAGVGPEVAAFVEPEGYLVTRFIEGRPIPPEEMRMPERLGQAAAALKAIHDGPAVPGRFDSFRIVEEYSEIAAAHGVERPSAYDRAHALAQAIERTRRREHERPCHNDLLNANFLDDGERIRIVDWEYAGMGDRFFDLANFSINHELGEAENELLLRAYFGRASEADRDALTLMRFMSDFREAMWGVVQQGISELDVDFVAYAHEHFTRLERTAADAGFRRALERSRP